MYRVYCQHWTAGPPRKARKEFADVDKAILHACELTKYRQVLLAHVVRIEPEDRPLKATLIFTSNRRRFTRLKVVDAAVRQEADNALAALSPAGFADPAPAPAPQGVAAGVSAASRK